MDLGMLVHHFEVIIWRFFTFFKIIWTGTNFFHYGLPYKNDHI